MWLSPFCSLLFLVASLAVTVSGHAPSWSRRHQEVAKRARADVDLHKRQTFTNARFTFYDVGLGACGQTNVPSDFIVALNVEQYGSGYPGPYCFQTITISYGGQTAQATIMDECMGCPWGGLDFSTGLFDYFASASEGVLYGTWWFNDGSGGGSGNTPTTSSTPQWTPTSTTPAWTPTTSSTPQYTPPTTTDVPTTTWSPPASSTTSSTPPPTTTSTVLTTSVTTDATSTTPTSVNSVASGLAIPTAAATSATGSSGAIAELNNALIEIGVLLSASKDST
ncbi:hypothetical protein F5141DRAFT_807255 [Pisolithus sp. B1]|nr:hypothetical protein F5141DRAFT_807255 [Pisolithus sp. B1]